MVPAAPFPCLCLAAAALLALLPGRAGAWTEPSVASAEPGDHPGAEPAGPSSEATPPPTPGSGGSGASAAGTAPEPAAAAPARDTWLDVGHAFVEHRLFAPVLRLDRFFSDERELEPLRARSFVRLRNNLRVRDEGDPIYTVDVSANLRFPGLNRKLERLRLVIAGQTEEAVNALLPDGAATALRARQIGRADAGLRYGAWEGLHSSVDLGAGLILELPPGAFGRVRHRASIPVRRLVLLRSATSVFWRTDTRFGTSLDLGAERPLGRASLARLEGSATLTERSRGVEWSSGLAFLRTLGQRSAILAGGGLEGAQRAPVGVDRYRLLARYRRDLFRHWVYVELEPEIAWPWSIERGRFRELALTFRLEVQFHGNEAPVPPPHELREPEDPTSPGPAGPRS